MAHLFKEMPWLYMYSQVFNELYAFYMFPLRQIKKKVTYCSGVRCGPCTFCLETEYNFYDLFQEMRQAFNAEAQSSGRSRLIISAAVSHAKTVIDAGYNVPQIAM